MQTTDVAQMVKDLEKAISNVHYLADNGSALADMHGLAYWAGVVERLRSEIRESLSI